MDTFIQQDKSITYTISLENSFALTVHKTQGLTLPNVTLILDNNLFSAGQAYVAISRCSSWENINIITLHRDAFITDKRIIEEYQRLQLLVEQPFKQITPTTT